MVDWGDKCNFPSFLSSSVFAFLLFWKQKKKELNYKFEVQHYLVWLQCLLKSWQRTLLTPPTLTDPFFINSANCKRTWHQLNWNIHMQMVIKSDLRLKLKWISRTLKLTSSSVSSINLSHCKHVRLKIIRIPKRLTGA